MKTSPRAWYVILTAAFARWHRHSAPTLSAAMAFYVLVSLAPLTVIAVGLVGSVLDEAEVHGYIMETSERLFDPETTELLAEVLATEWVSRSDPVGGALAVLMLVFASTAGFNHLRGSLNRVFESQPRERGAVSGLMRGRALAFAVVLVFGATILMSLVLRTLLFALSTIVENALPLPLPLFNAIEIVVFLAIITGLFAFVFRVLPDRRLPWRPLFVGAAMTSVLFLVGIWLIGAYLGRVGLGSAFGVAGSTVVLAAWVYYSSMVFFLGAAVTCEYTERRAIDEAPLLPPGIV
jgi:membrane protein